jgi:atypical dual specificity phosphatase
MMESLFGEKIVIYGEWLFACHTVRYDTLPDKFIAYDVWIPSEKCFVDSRTARSALVESGFCVVHELHTSGTVDLAALKTLSLSLRDGPSAYSTQDSREGAYLKLSKQNRLLDRYKIVSKSFTPGARWDSRSITKNQVKR